MSPEELAIRQRVMRRAHGMYHKSDYIDNANVRAADEKVLAELLNPEYTMSEQRLDAAYNMRKALPKGTPLTQRRLSNAAQKWLAKLKKSLAIAAREAKDFGLIELGDTLNDASVYTGKLSGDGPLDSILGE